MKLAAKLVLDTDRYKTFRTVGLIYCILGDRRNLENIYCRAPLEEGKTLATKQAGG
jgi:hypothetical protein